MGVYLGSNKVGITSLARLEYEEGTWIPSEDIARGTINFTRTHTEPPIVIVLADATGTTCSTTYTNHAFMWWNYDLAYDTGIPYAETGFRYATASYSYRGTSTTALTNAITICTQPSSSTGDSSTSYPRYWATETSFYPYTNGTDRYWRTDRTYKWIAIWK